MSNNFPVSNGRLVKFNLVTPGLTIEIFSVDQSDICSISEFLWLF